MARPTQVERLPACKSGWKLDAALPQAAHDIPMQYLYQVLPGAPRHMVIHVVGPDGKLLARVKRGQRAAFDCLDERCGPGDNCV